MDSGGRLQGLGCLIIGGTSGIGLETARRFLQEGARVLVVGRPTDSLEDLNAQLSQLGPSWVVSRDASLESDVDLIFQTAYEVLNGRIDILFHVAGMSGRRLGDGPLHDCQLQGWDTVLDQNARSVFLTNRAAVRQMRTQEIGAGGLRGTVLNMGSVLASSPSPTHFGTYAYAASKAATEGMTKLAAAQYAPEKIRFNVLAPGLIDTPMAARAVANPEIQGFLRTKQPISDGPGTVSDCAEAALFLCEPASRMITGTVLHVDGGWRVSEGRCYSGEGTSS